MRVIFEKDARPCVALTVDLIHGVKAWEFPSFEDAVDGMENEYGFRATEYKIHTLDFDPLGAVRVMA